VYKQWGTALYARGLTLREIDLPRYQGRLAAGILTKGALTFAAVSVHAPIIRDRVFPHLDYIFDDIEAAMKTQSAIVGGDLNSARLCEIAWPGYGHGPFFERIARGPFVDCHWQLNGKEIQTFFRKNSSPPFQDDHIFASPDLAERLTFCSVVNNASTRRLSDHIPIIAELDIEV
jgi:endonuclease/exonuclease/phosphatase family metal-dependent hydrolase